MNRKEAVLDYISEKSDVASVGLGLAMDALEKENLSVDERERMICQRDFYTERLADWRKFYLLVTWG